MDHFDDFKTLRRYTRLEAAHLLRIPDTWLKRWVTSRSVPHQRSGNVKGVWFTYADVLAIGELLPGLMSDTQVNRRAEGAPIAATPNTVAARPCDERSGTGPVGSVTSLRR